jgi:hypothetical protein
VIGDKTLAVITHRMWTAAEARGAVMTAAPFLPTVAERALAETQGHLQRMVLTRGQQRQAFADLYRSTFVSEWNRVTSDAPVEGAVTMTTGLRNGIVLRLSDHPGAKIRVLCADRGARVHSPTSTSRVREYGQDVIPELVSLPLVGEAVYVLLWTRTAAGIGLDLVSPRAVNEQRRSVSVHWATRLPHTLELLDSYDDSLIALLDDHEDLEEYRLRTDVFEDGDDPA